jgi:hypothetical protein
MISYIQSAQLATSGTSATLAFSSSPGAGHTLVVTGRVAPTITSETPSANCTDSLSNTFAHAGGIYNGNGSTKFQTDIFVTVNATAAADSITYTSSVSGTIDIAIHEYSGLVTSNATILDPTGFAAATDGGSASTTPSSGGANPSSVYSLLFGVVATDSGTATFTAGNMGTNGTASIRQNVSGLLVTEDINAFPADLYQANGTLSTAEHWSALLVSLAAPYGYLCPIGVEAQFFTNAGAVLASGKITTYLAGTATTTATYTDYTLSTANPNPIILSSAGRLPAGVWQSPGVPIKAVISDSGGTVLMTIDNISGIGDPSAAGREGVSQVPYPETTAERAAGATVVNYSLPPGQVDRYFANTQPGTTAANVGFTSSIAQAQQPLGAPVTVNTSLALSSSVTIPDGVSLRVISGTINIAASSILEIIGPFTAPRAACFTGSGTVVFGNATVSASDGCLTEAYPEWWGAIADSTASNFGTDCTNAIAACITACSGGTLNVGLVPLRLGSGYYLTGNQTLTPALTIRGTGRATSGFIAKAGTGGITSPTVITSSASVSIGTPYTIITVGSTNWVAMGASSNTAGVTFVATNTGTGSGTATATAWFHDDGNAEKIILEDFAMYCNSANCPNMQFGLRLGYATGGPHGTEGYLRGLWVRDCACYNPGSMPGFGLDVTGNVGFYDLCSIYGPSGPAGGAGPIANVTGIVGGSGYTNGTYTGVLLTSSPGSGAQATVTVAGGAITAVAITVGGTGYKAGNTVTFTSFPSGGSGFQATVVLSGQTAVSNVDSIVGGTGYTNGTYTGVTLTGGSGTGAQATIIVKLNVVSNVAITQGGSGYIVGNTLSATFGGGSGFSVTVASVGAFAGVSLFRMMGQGSMVSNVALIGAGVGAYCFYESNSGGRVSGMEIEAPASCANNTAPLSIQEPAYHEDILISLNASSGTSFDHLVELASTVFQGTLGITFANSQSLGIVTGGNILNEAASPNVYMGGNCSLNNSNQGTAFYAWPLGNLVSGNATVAGVSSVTVKLPFPLTVTNYKVSLTCIVTSGSFPPSPPCVQSGSKTGTQFVIEFSAAWSGTVDWSVIVD